MRRCLLEQYLPIHNLKENISRFSLNKNARFVSTGRWVLGISIKKRNSPWFKSVGIY